LACTSGPESMNSPHQVFKPFWSGLASQAHWSQQKSPLAAGWFIDRDFLILMYRFRR
jgi:hypothetical protein